MNVGGGGNSDGDGNGNEGNAEVVFVDDDDDDDLEQEQEVQFQDDDEEEEEEEESTARAEDEAGAVNNNDATTAMNGNSSTTAAAAAAAAPAATTTTTTTKEDEEEACSDRQKQQQQAAGDQLLLTIRGVFDEFRRQQQQQQQRQQQQRTTTPRRIRSVPIRDHVANQQRVDREIQALCDTRTSWAHDSIAYYRRWYDALQTHLIGMATTTTTPTPATSSSANSTASTAAAAAKSSSPPGGGGGGSPRRRQHNAPADSYYEIDERDASDYLNVSLRRVVERELEEELKSMNDSSTFESQLLRVGGGGDDNDNNNNNNDNNGCSVPPADTKIDYFDVVRELRRRQQQRRCGGGTSSASSSTNSRRRLQRGTREQPQQQQQQQQQLKNGKRGACNMSSKNGDDDDDDDRRMATTRQPDRQQQRRVRPRRDAAGDVHSTEHGDDVDEGDGIDAFEAGTNPAGALPSSQSARDLERVASVLTQLSEIENPASLSSSSSSSLLAPSVSSRLHALLLQLEDQVAPTNPRLEGFTMFEQSLLQEPTTSTKDVESSTLPSGARDQSRYAFREFAYRTYRDMVNEHFGLGDNDKGGRDGDGGGGGKRSQPTAAVTLNTRVRKGSALHKICAHVAGRHGMASRVCTRQNGWTFGPTGAAVEPVPASPNANVDDVNQRNKNTGFRADPRFYLILALNGGTTPTHLDSGFQTVLYHTVAGMNRIVGVPRFVAALLQASRAGLEGFRQSDVAERFEASVLKLCADRGCLEYGEFAANETMLILPRGGHCVVSGPFKVVLAGEYHNDDLATAGAPPSYSDAGGKPQAIVTVPAGAKKPNASSRPRQQRKGERKKVLGQSRGG